MDVNRKPECQYLSDKIGFKTKTVTIDKEGHYIIIKGTIQQEDITIVNIYALDMGVPKYIKHSVENIRELNNSKQ